MAGSPPALWLNLDISASSIAYNIITENAEKVNNKMVFIKWFNTHEHTIMRPA